MSKASKQKNDTVFVTQPNLPELLDFVPYLEEIWASKHLTNNGQFHQQLERELSEYLGVPYISLFNNGTNALLTAIQSLSLQGEVITTPYTFLATANSIIWNGLTPVFVDIDPKTLNIDPMEIESKITNKTSAILGVHCYGMCCDVDMIQSIADKYQLKVIYDAAHAFAVEDERGSILNYGDLSVLSFHATKVFNTFEGGAIICSDEESKHKIDQLKNFGLVGETEICDAGLNGKMSEVNAAMGLLQLKSFDEVLLKRKAVDSQYRKLLSDIPGIRLLPVDEYTQTGFSYFPILVEKSFPVSRDELNEVFHKSNILTRKYFYPLLPDFDAIGRKSKFDPEQLNIAYQASSQVLCLPMYANLSLSKVHEIASVILNYNK